MFSKPNSRHQQHRTTFLTNISRASTATGQKRGKQLLNQTFTSFTQNGGIAAQHNPDMASASS